RTSQQLTVQILNGAYKGEQLQIDNSYTKSGAYDEAYRQGQKVFVGIHERESVLEGEVVDAKRDSYFVIIVSFFVIVLLIVGNKQGLFSIISFLVNAFILSLALDLYVAYPSISRSEEHTSELQSRFDLVCRLLLEKKKNKNDQIF